jgi:hypothetical protein
MDNPQQSDSIAPELRSAWRFSLVQQFAIGLTVIAMNDRTRIYAAVIALAVFWAGVGFIIFLRRAKPILIDLLFVRWSFPLIWLVALLVLVRLFSAGAATGAR